jgi:hypothetical protein
MQKLIPFIHPAIMWGTLGLYFYTAYLGWQSRRIRSVKAETREELNQSPVGFKHASMGAILLGLFIIGGSLGLIATYLSTGAVLSGAHGRIGVLMMVLIGATASLAPALRAGADWARTAHISIGITLLLLYVGEILSGGQIIQSIIKAQQF